MKAQFILATGILIGGITGQAGATTINVSAGGNVQAAVDSAGVTGDEIVLATGNYSGSVNISGKSLVLRGASAATRPVFSFTATVTYGTSGAGMAIRGDGTSVTLRDIVFLPGTTGFTGAVKGIASATLAAAAAQSVSIENCLFAPNNGSDQPLFSDPFSNTAITGGWPNDILYLNNSGFLGVPTGIGTYVVKDTTLIGAGRDAFICYPDGVGSSLTVSGSAIAHSARHGIQWGDNDLASTAMTISGTRAKPGLIMRKNNLTLASVGAGVDGINGAGPVNISRLVYLENPANAAGFVITADNTGTVNITDSLFASNTGRGIWFPVNLVKTPAVTISKSTFFANATSIENVSPTPTYTFRDNVFAGAGTGVSLGGGAGAKTTLQNNALVTAGANALTAQLAGEAPAANTGVVTADPQFASTSIVSLAALQTAFNVTNNAYSTASSTSGGLSGWGTAPAAPAAAANWSLFE